MKKYIFLVSLSLAIILILIQSVFFTSTASTAGSTPKQPTQKLARLSAQITVQAVGQDNPLINLRSGRDLLTSYLGSSNAQLTLEQNLARPTVLASADFDEDGTADLIAGYAGPLGGILTIHRGNVDAIYPNSPEAIQRKAEGSFTESPFIAPAHVLELPEAPDFVATGDFDADGHWDLAMAANGSNSLYLLSGDGHGSFSSPKPFDLPGRVTALASGEINRADGLTDLAVAVVAEQGAQVLVFEGPQGALRSDPEAFSLPAPATGLAVGRLNADYLFDLAAAAGPALLVVEGRDRKLSLDAALQSEVPQAVIKQQSLPFGVRSMSVGNFDTEAGEELALLADDGTLHLLTRPEEDGIEKEVGNVAGWSSKRLSAVVRPGASHLITARVSTAGGDDLVIADSANNQLHIVTSEIGRQGLTAAILNVAGDATAVLPMRLNADALSDLVILRSNQVAPTIVNSSRASFTVTNINDSETGSLRQAIIQANQTPGPDLIDFNIGQGGAQTINPLTALPTITDPVTIDGTTQPGFAGTPIIELNGTGLPPGTNGLLISGGSTTVRGLAINRFGGNADAIEFQTNGGNIVEGNFIGTNFTGNSALPNGGNGVFINGPPNNRIGGTTVAARNVISGNGRGIFISGISGINTTGNLVQGNFIGTNAAGTADLGNGTNGVFLFRAVTTIGGTVAGARNIISGNNNSGIGFDSTSGTLVQGNFIGTDVTGTVDLGNTQMGVQVTTASANNTLGGTTPAARNIVSGNTIHGFQIRQTGTNGNLVQGNLIGTQINGTSALGNGGVGVSVENLANNNSVGGTAGGAGNIVAFNNDDGVDIVGGTGNAVLSNSIFSNSGLGIDLSANGVTPNDVGDGDTGANNLQNFPVLNSATSGVNTVVQGTLNSTANSTFTIQFFSNTACDAPGNGEGQTFLGSTSVTTDAGGNGSFSAGVPASLTASQVVTATATDLNNNTSEFSACRQVALSSFSISGRIADGSGQSLPGVTVTVSGAASSSTTTDANGNYSFSSLAASGNYTVTPSSSNYSFSPANQTFNNLNVNRIANFVATQTTVSISGKVTNANNAGISNVTVVLTKDGLQNATTLTNGLGDYSFGNLTAGANYVVTPAGSFSPSSQSFSNLTVNAVANFKAAPSIPPQCNTVSFGRTDFAAGSGPRSVAIGDFNNDGKSDLAVTNQGSANISILPGTGTGSFSAATNFAVGSGSLSVAIGDFNGDGKSDLAVANFGSNNVSILLGSGTGSFSAATNFAVGSFPLFVAVGDFNNDGKSDLATANSNSNNVSILLGSGTGSFSAATNFAVGSGSLSVAIGDFNGDGKSDLATANSNSNNVSILLGSGAGSFSAAANFVVGGSPRSVVIGDFNGDGKSDLATANQNSNNVSILLGSGTGSFSAATNFAVGSNPISVAIGDFNGDGKSDLATANASSNNVSILLGSGTGSFSAATNFAVGNAPESVAIGDFNGDGKSDLATANATSANVSILLNNSATCNTQSSLTISGRTATANNNSLADVIVTLSGPITRVAQTDVNGNYAFANLAPGGNYTVTIQSPQYVFAPSRADFFNLSSNQTANFTAAPVAVPVPTPPLSDDFTSPVRDPNKWNLGTQTQPAAAVDPQVTTAQINGQLVITPLNQASGMHYNGYVAANAFDLRNGKATVEVVKAATGGADTTFAIGSDSNNFFRFLVHTVGGPTNLVMVEGADGLKAPLDTTTPQLIFQVKINGLLTPLSIDYDPVLHRFMRFRHEPPAVSPSDGAIVFETSQNNIDFTVRHRILLEKGVSPMTAELSAGTSSPTNAGQAVFDNFSLTTSTFQFSSGSYTVGEGDGSVLITVTRSGDTSTAGTVDFATADGTARQGSKYLNAAGSLTFAAGQTSKTFSVSIVDNDLAEGNQTVNLLLGNPVGAGFNSPGRAVLNIVDNDTLPPIWQSVVLTAGQVEIKTWTFQGTTYAYVKLLFPNAGYRVVNFGQATRAGNDFTGDASIERFTGASVQAVTTTAGIYDLGILSPGSYNFTFKNSGTVVKTQPFTVAAPPFPPNPIDNAREFVKQQYRDFLNREADQAGEDFWTDNITKCSDPARRPADQTEAQCTLRQRETTSGAFFLSPEFQYTGYYVYRMYQGGLGRQPKLSEFTPDAQFVGAGILVNSQLSGAKINQNKADFAAQFVNCTDPAKSRCAEFKVIYDGLNNQQYVDKLFLTTGINASAADRAALVNGLNANPATETRASVLQKVVDGIVVIAEGNQQFTTSYGQAFYNAESNRAFVQLQYFGYMKRDPDDAGYAFWLGKLNQFGGNFVNAEMVLAFISSPEYRARFGQP